MNPHEYPWQEPLRDAVEETDIQKLSKKLEVAETAIFLRLQQLAISSDGKVETEAIQKACKELAKMQTERLNWPPVDLDRSSQEK